MKTINDAILFGLATSKGMVNGFTADLKAGDWEHRTVPGSNCAAWLVGHLLLVDRRALVLLGVTDLPALPDGFETRFGREANAPQAETFGDTSILIPLFNRHREMLMQAASTLTESKLEEPHPRASPRFRTIGEFFVFISLHAVLHAGQISTIRRSLGRPPLF